MCVSCLQPFGLHSSTVVGLVVSSQVFQEKVKANSSGVMWEGQHASEVPT